MRRQPMTYMKRAMGVIGFIAVFAATAVWARAQMPMHHDSAAAAKAPAPIRATMATLHAQGGVPKGWKFLMPPGNAAAGRKVFVAMECFPCHEVKGEDFPRESKTPRGAGPELTGMGGHHPAEY